MEENEKLKQKESNVVLENIVIEDYAMTKMEEELEEKEKIKELEKEKVRNKITEETQGNIDKMEKLYVKLYLAQRELAYEKEKQKCLIM